MTTTDASSSVTSRNGLRAHMRDLHARQDIPWAEIGALYDVSGGMAWRFAVENYEPKDPEIRRKLHLPVLGKAQAVGGAAVVDGSEIGVDSNLCANADCRRPFIPNAHNRRYCFSCSPYRGK